MRPKDPKENKRSRNIILFTLIGVLIIIALTFVLSFATM
jgi:predicted nucleic acid-binding Zn ribbon protein